MCGSIVLFDNGRVEITLREVLFSVLIAGLMALAGFFIAGSIESHVVESTLKYRQAAQISSTNEFVHAMRTDAGYAFVEGEFKTVSPVKSPYIEGDWLRIREATQHWTMHVRHYTTSDGKGHVCHHTRVYHSWDTVSVENFHTGSVEFCGAKFKYDKFDYSLVPDSVREIHRLGPTDRIVVTCAAPSFKASIFAKLANKTVGEQPTIYMDTTIDKLYEDLTTSYAVAVFWTVWVLLAVALVSAFCILDNYWLND